MLIIEKERDSSKYKSFGCEVTLNYTKDGLVFTLFSYFVHVCIDFHSEIEVGRFNLLLLKQQYRKE